MRIGMVVIRGNAVVMLKLFDDTNIDMPKVGRQSTKRREHILPVAFETGCNCLELAAERCESMAGLQHKLISGPNYCSPVHHLLPRQVWRPHQRTQRSSPGIFRRRSQGRHQHESHQGKGCLHAAREVPVSSTH